MIMQNENNTDKTGSHWYFSWCLGIYREAILDRLRQIGRFKS
jgi:hypothetical protein